MLGEYVYKNLAGTERTMYDENGSPETVFLARESDRVKKDGAKRPHKVLDKLAGYRGDSIRARAIVQMPEVLETSRYKESTDEHSHQWMDEHGWIIRTVYLQGKNGNIYEAALNIADDRDRRILYKINRVRQIDRAKSPGEHTATGDSQRFRYRKPGAGGTQSEDDVSVAETAGSVKLNNDGMSGTKSETQDNRTPFQRETCKRTAAQKAGLAKSQGRPVIGTSFSFREGSSPRRGDVRNRGPLRDGGRGGRIWRRDRIAEPRPPAPGRLRRRSPVRRRRA